MAHKLLHSFGDHVVPAATAGDPTPRGPNYGSLCPSVLTTEVVTGRPTDSRPQQPNRQQANRPPKGPSARRPTRYLLKPYFPKFQVASRSSHPRTWRAGPSANWDGLHQGVIETAHHGALDDARHVLARALALRRVSNSTDLISPKGRASCCSTVVHDCSRGL